MTESKCTGVVSYLTGLRRLLDEQEVAEILGWGLATLRRRRFERKAPSFVKIGSSVRYDPVQIMEFIDESRRQLGGGSGQEDGER